MKKNSQKDKSKFIGGLRVGITNRSWPFCELEVNEETLLLRDKTFDKEYIITKEDVSMIYVKKSLPIIGCGIQIKHSKVEYDKKIIFWYNCFRFKKLLCVLKNNGWNVE